MLPSFVVSFDASLAASGPMALLPVAPALAGASGLADPEAGDGATGGTALLPVAPDFAGCVGEAAEPDVAPLWPRLVDQTVLGPELTGFADASMTPAAPAPLDPGLTGSVLATVGLAGSVTPGLGAADVAAGGVASPGFAPAPLDAVPVAAAGLAGSTTFGVSAGLGVALDGMALLPVEPGLAGAPPGVAEAGLPEVSPGRSVGLPRSSADEVTGVSSLFSGLPSDAAS
ncbi:MULTISPECIES: hypothetical protein [Methylobacterium]|uniref:hypothetical protein n=1 Tax=Methylobacterium TaxID=407 RepID=UPI0011C91C6E|nr:MULTISPECIES: hypothetical protein [Methylobacterium]TXN19189.1 hypothetical protein FV217_22190 [Methylobacterium sp. WL9]